MSGMTIALDPEDPRRWVCPKCSRKKKFPAKLGERLECRCGFSAAHPTPVLK